MAASNQARTLIREVYEKGIETRRGDDGRFYFQSVQSGQSAEVTANPKVTYGVRRILFTERLASGQELTWLLSSAGEILLGGLSDLSQVVIHNKGMRILEDYFSVSYVVGATCHHCQRLAEAYADISRRFASSLAKMSNSDDMVYFGHEPEPFYEFDALITAAMRSYDTMRFILWTAFGDKGSRPVSFQEVFEKVKNNLSPTLVQHLDRTWLQFGEKLKDYRDCIQHYVPLSGEIPSACMKRLDRGVWSTSYWLPENPKAKSAKEFRFRSQLDALTYGWELANEIMDTTKAIVQEVPDEASA